MVIRGLTAFMQEGFFSWFVIFESIHIKLRINYMNELLYYISNELPSGIFTLSGNYGNMIINSKLTHEKISFNN